MASTIIFMFDADDVDDSRVDWQAVVNNINTDIQIGRVEGLETMPGMDGIRGVRLRWSLDQATIAHLQKLRMEIERAVTGIVFGPQVALTTFHCDEEPWPMPGNNVHEPE